MTQVEIYRSCATRATGARLAILLAAASLVIACHRTRTARPLTADGFLDHQHRSVIHLSTDCTGSLIAPDRVLTAAHCVAGAADVEARAGGEVLEVARCELHPNLRSNCLDLSPRVHAEHDMALLRLRRAVHHIAPLAVALDRPTNLEHVRLVGFFRQPLVVGAARRYSGINRVVRDEGRLLYTEPDDPHGFATRLGSSGGPALHRDGTRERIIGVLHGGKRPLSRDSVYVTTYHPDTAAWLRRTLRALPTEGLRTTRRAESRILSTHPTGSVSGGARR